MEKRPNFLIIGAQKGGSTWLYDMLKQHKEIFLPSKVEVHHFNRVKYHTDELIEEYRRHFERRTDKQKMIGEKTPSYFWIISKKREFYNPEINHNPNLVSDVKKQLGDELKILVSLRHPVKRAVSAFFHHVKMGRITGNVSISKYFMKYGIIDIGFYSEHYSAWLKEYNENQIKLLIMERDIIAKPSDTLVEICKFLNVSETLEVEAKRKSNEGLKVKWENGKVSLTSSNSPYISSSDIEYMMSIYKEDMSKLRVLLNDPLEEWHKVDEELRSFVKQNKK